jgi:hypothetical protein
MLYAMRLLHHIYALVIIVNEWSRSGTSHCHPQAQLRLSIYDINANITVAINGSVRATYCAKVSIAVSCFERLEIHYCTTKLF